MSPQPFRANYAGIDRKSARKKLVTEVACYSALVAGCALALAPIFWGIATSLKHEVDVITYPPHFAPISITFENYRAVLAQSSTGQLFLNSLLLSVGTIIVAVVTAVPAAFAAARFQFGTKNALLFGILAMSMVPGISILIPIYILASKFGLVNNFGYMILVYSAWMVPQAVWFIKGFIEALPRELDEAALIDGSSQVGVLIHVILPLIRPGLAAISMLVFMFVWNDYLINAVLASTENSRTVQVALVRQMQNTVGVSWGQFTAFATLVIAPVLFMFLALQRWFIQGLASGSVKG